MNFSERSHKHHKLNRHQERVLYSHIQAMDQINRIAELQREIDDLRKRWPAHSTSPALLQRLDELEEELDNIKDKTTA
jgi:hypothetical protein